MWTSLAYPWMVTVTPAYGDTLTWRGRVDIPGLSMDGHSAKYKATVSSMNGSGLSGTVNAIGTCILSTLATQQHGWMDA